jgi:glycosyltransferase involved in cell wall biosynthesis
MLVSILIPCFNAERWVAEAIESALAQTWPEKEIVVVDDGSTDGSLATIRTFGDRIRWETGPNRGGNAARNRLLHLARGEYLQYLDADDYLLPNKVAVHVEILDSRQDADVVYGPIIMEHRSEKATCRAVLPIPPPHDPWVLLARWYLPQTGAALWRKQTLVEVGGWNPDLPCCQEHELYARLLMAGKRFKYCDQPGAIYRQWGDHTISKRDIAEVHRQRLDIERSIEAFLLSRNALTSARLHAINQARFETARLAWQYDPGVATEIMKQVETSEPTFRPEPGPAAPTRYRVALRMLGFRGAQRLADWARGLLPRGTPA